MSKEKTIERQIQQAISNCRTYGHSRHKDKQGNDDLDWKIYSMLYARNLFEFGKGLGRFMQMEHPDIKRVVDIKKEQIQEFLDRKAGVAADSSLAQYVSYLHKLEKCIGHTYKVQTKWSLEAIKTPRGTMAAKQRDKTIDVGTCSRILEAMPRTTETWKAVILAQHAGLRIGEAAGVHRECISFTGGRYGYGTVQIRGGIDGAKSGRPRTIDIISREDQQALRTAINGVKTGQNVVRKKDGTAYTVDGLEKAFRRAMEKAGFTLEERAEIRQNAYHGLRKEYAQHCYNTVREETKGQEDSKKQAYEFVDAQLGHGKAGKHRQDIMDIYVKNQW